jgi:cytochrome c
MEIQSRKGSMRCAITATALTIAIAPMICCGYPAWAAGDATRGQILYQGCQDCHSIDKNDVGPMHKGVVGRISGTVPGYNYSPALRNAKIVWTAENLDKWLTDPQQDVLRCPEFPGSRRPDRLSQGARPLSFSATVPDFPQSVSKSRWRPSFGKC